MSAGATSGAILAFLRSAVFTIVFYLGSVLTVTGALLAGMVSRTGLYLGPKIWAGWFVWCSRWITGVRLCVEGDIPAGPHLFAIKHESAYETFLTLWLFTRPAVVMKAALKSIPVWGAASTRHGSIFVDREGSAAMLRAMMRAARAAVDDGRPVIIFPEGTRVPHGKAPALRPGFAGLYRALGLPVVPVAHDSGNVWPRGFVKYPGTIRFKVGETIPPGLKRAEVEPRVLAAINALTPAN